MCGVGEVRVERSWQERGVELLLEDGAFSLLHPGVVLHKLWVKEGILGDALFDPLHQVSDCFGGLLSLEGQLIFEALHLLLHLG